MTKMYTFIKNNLLLLLPLPFYWLYIILCIFLTICFFSIIIYLLQHLISSTNEAKVLSNDQSQFTIEKIGDKDKIQILIERYKESWNQATLIHDIEWKTITIVITIVSGLIGLTVLRKELVLPIFFLSLVAISFGFALAIRNRTPYLNHMMIIARIERLLKMHGIFPEFKDKRLLPEEFIKLATYDYDTYIKIMKWRLKSTFFCIIAFYILLIIGVLGFAILYFFI